MFLLGYLAATLGLILMYFNELLLGGIVFFLAGWFANRLSLSLRSSGLIIMLESIAYGYHNTFSSTVIACTIIGFLLANCRSKSSKEDVAETVVEWGFDIFSSGGSSHYSDKTDNGGSWGSGFGDGGGSDSGGAGD